MLDRDRATRTQIYDPNGFLGFIRFNHPHPPFNDVRVRRAIRDVVVQPDFMQAVALPQDWQQCHSMLPCGLPGAMEFPPAPRGEAAMQRARDALREAGYNGEPVVHINPSDFRRDPAGPRTVDLMRRLGVNIQAVESDWASIIARRANRAPPAQGGWNLHNTNGPAATIANPAVSWVIRMNGAQAWPGWPEDAVGWKRRSKPGRWRRMPRPRPRRCNALQELAWEAVPIAPTGLFRLRTAFRSDLTGVLQAPNPMLWNSRRG